MKKDRWNLNGSFRLELLSRLERPCLRRFAGLVSPFGRLRPVAYSNIHRIFSLTATLSEFKSARLKKRKSRPSSGLDFLLELLSRLELPNLILTKDALYRLSYNSICN